ncbi:MAG TPA: hypothetical protein VK427_01090, partial [Kofleriaceae bacterium]|nr:hypothetical protein [Kofleriaceae bacterium]
MVHVVDERDAACAADRQQILDGVGPVVIFEDDARACAIRQPVEPGGEAGEGGRLAAARTAAVDRELLRADELR